MPKLKKEETKKTAPQKEEKKKFDLKKIKMNIPEKFKPVVKILGLVVVIIASLALIDLVVQYINNDFSVAVVNGTRISQTKWHNRLEKSYGSTIATQLIEEEIVKKEAKKENVVVDKEEIDKEIDAIIESIGGQETFDAALVANNITLEELKDQIEVDLLVKKILSPSIEYTEQDVMDFFNQYSDVIFPNETAALEEGEKLSFEEYKEETEDIYIQQQVQTKQATWLTEKKSEYKIQDNSTGKPKYGFLTITTNIVNNIFNKDK